MSNLFTPEKLGNLIIPNRFVRSATVERMADAKGFPLPRLTDLWVALARGGVGLIVTGHMYVLPAGKASREMMGIYSDEHIPALKTCVEAVHEAGGLIAPQLNHGGVRCDPGAVEEPVAPSDIDDPSIAPRKARAMTIAEIEEAIEAFGQAARRAQEAGFDAVQIHGAHGYLVSQFLSPLTNRRTDAWGGSLSGRMRFLREVCRSVRRQVGSDFPFFIKLGMADGVEGGLTLEDTLQVAAELQTLGLDGVEISGAMSGPLHSNVSVHVRTEADEAYFRAYARAAKTKTNLPVMLVGGLRSQHIMEDVLASGDADFISLCRPLISEPDLPQRFRRGVQQRSRCISALQCHPRADGEGIACKCALESV